MEDTETMKRLVACCVLLVATTACGGPSDDPAPTSEPTASASPSPVGASGPAGAVEGLMRALDAGDCDAAQALVLTPSNLGCDQVELSAGSFAEEGNDLDAATYRAGEASGPSTTVTIDWGSENPDETYDVQQVDGAWLVVFDSAA